MATGAARDLSGSGNPPPSADPTQPCEKCNWPVNAEILADTPDCPHGWLSLEGMCLADIKAAFASDPELSIDPRI